MQDLTNKIVTPITLYTNTDLNNRPAYIYAKQYDANSRYIRVTFQNGTKKIFATGSPTLNAILPDGQCKYVGGEVADDGTAVIELKSSILALVGKVSCDITIYTLDSNDEKVALTSSTFYIIVDKSNYDPSAIEGNDDMSAVGEILNQIADDRAAIEAAKEDIETATEEIKEIFPSVEEFASRVENMENQIADLMYKPITIDSFTHGYTRTLERGVVITDVTLTWTTNKTPTVLLLDGQAIDPNKTEHSVNDNLAITWDNTKRWELTARGERDDDVYTEKTPSFVFYNGIYYGVVDTETEIDRDVILGLKKELRGNLTTSFTVSPQNAQRIVFACPSRLGTPIFNIRGLDYEWENVAPDSFGFKNESDYTETYDIWRSCQDISETITIKVSRKEG